MKNHMDLIWHEEYHPLRKSDVFYCAGDTHTPVVTISFNNHEVLISCDGEFDFTHNDIRIRHFWDLIDAGIKTDVEWAEAISNAQDQHYSTPWFDAYEYSEITPYGDHLDMVNGDIDDAIVMAQRYLMENYYVH